MAISIPGGSRGGDSSQNAVAIGQVQDQLRRLQTRLNTQPNVASPVNGSFPNSASPGSISARYLQDGSIALSVGVGNGLGSEVTLQNNPASGSYVGPQSGTGVPTVGTNFPNAGQFGWYLRTSNSKWYWTLNSGGTLVFQDISTLAGSITDAQHGDFTGDPGTYHSFAQITGTLSAAQHGAQTVTTLHAVATATTAGFMSSTQAGNLTSAVAAISAIQSTGAGSFTINGTGHLTNGVQVVGARNTGWSRIGTFTSTKALTTNTSALTTTQLGDILYTIYTALVTHGLIGP